MPALSLSFSIFLSVSLSLSSNRLLQGEPKPDIAGTLVRGVTGVLGKIVNNLVGADEGKNVAGGNPSEAKEPLGEAVPSTAGADGAGAATSAELNSVAEESKGTTADVDSAGSNGRIDGDTNGGINDTKEAEEVRI